MALFEPAKRNTAWAEIFALAFLHMQIYHVLTICKHLIKLVTGHGIMHPVKVAAAEPIFTYKSMCYQFKFI
jgi:hypothetical protein